MTPVTLDTPRLRLRPYTLSDVPDLIRLAGAREVAATTLRIPHPYRDEDAVNFIAASQSEADRGSCSRFAITLRETGLFCGGVGLRIEVAHQNAELGYWVGVPYWGQGYATEAARAVVAYGFAKLGLLRIYASCFPENTASTRVLKKLGMQHEGRQRSHICKWGTLHDLDLYGLLRDDKESSKGR